MNVQEQFDHTFVYVRTADELSALADAWLPLVEGGDVALDIEETRETTYLPRVALLQLTVPGHDAVIDPLLLPGKPLAAFIEALSLTAGRVIVHGCNNDIAGMKRDFGVAPLRVRDTQVAARFCGLTQFGLAALLRDEFGVELDKSLRRSDWNRRPLTAALLDYARGDTRYLHGLWAVLEERCASAGWMDAVEEECDALAAIPAEKMEFDSLGWTRVKGVQDLDDVGRARASAMWSWRDRVAETLDVHPSRVLPPWGLLLLADRGSRGLEARRSNGILDAVGSEQRAELGRLLDDPPPVHAPRRERTRLPPSAFSASEFQQRLDWLMAWRNRTAEDLGLEPGFLASRGVLESIARTRLTSLEDLLAIEDVRRWRVVRWGDAWLSRLGGAAR